LKGLLNVMVWRRCTKNSRRGQSFSEWVQRVCQRGNWRCKHKQMTLFQPSNHMVLSI